MYVIELKSASEARRDRLLPLLAQAILQVQAAARRSKGRAAPLAVVAAPRVPDSFVEDARRFAAEYAPNVAIGVIDLEGFRAFAGPSLDELNAPRADAPARLAPHAPSVHLFSDGNQWMLKVLLAPRLPEALLAAPRAEYRNASELASASGVSVMSAFRLLRQLRADGFLGEAPGRVRLVRVGELLRRWQAESLRSVVDLPMRWILPGDSHAQLREALGEHTPRSESVVRPGGRACLALFAAADALGVGVVHGVPPYIYLENPRTDVVRRLGMRRAGPGERADLYVRVPGPREAIFRAAVGREGVAVCDVLQVWLDVSAHPARGSAQAEEIRRRVLALYLEERHP